MAAELRKIVPLLGKPHYTGLVLERDTASAGSAFPQISEFLANLDKDAERCPDEGIKHILPNCSEIVRRRTLDSTDYLFQFAYVLTPKGR
jgi:hypothetical protein